jgi:phage repressor protein C with HTH and peptisase S24 domain
MITHERLWGAIEVLADRNGYSLSGLARRAGLDPTAFNRSKRIGPEGKPRWPSTESLALVLEVTGTSLSDFGSLVENPPGAPSRRRRAARGA